jgi:putative sporulation protein YtaF
MGANLAMWTDWVFVIGLSVASNVDNLAVGVAYGTRAVRFSAASNLLIATICLGLSEIGVLFGGWAGEALTARFAIFLGAAFLFVIGIRVVVGTARLRRPTPTFGHAPTTSWRHLMSRSERLLFAEGGRVGFVETLVLGVALSANAFTNAMGGGLLGAHSVSIPLANAVGSFVSIGAGVLLGKLVRGRRLFRLDFGQCCGAASGLMLMTVAVVSVTCESGLRTFPP